MAKKYSVQVENDKVVSVVVDGVTYANPDEIPDKQDRKKINRLVSRTLDTDSDNEEDEAFDRAFDKDFKDLEKQSRTFPKLLLGIFLGIAIIMLAITVFSAYGAAQTISREKSTPGKVVALVVQSSRDSSTGEVTNYTYPVVEYTPPDSRILRVQMSEGSSPPDFSVGDPVTVLYDPQKPADSRVKSFSSALLLWILPGITFLVGVGFTIASVVIIKVWPPNQKENKQ